MPPKPILVAPYPSYGHLSTNGTEYTDALFLDKRRVLVLLAASTRRSNPTRRALFKQLANATSLSIEQYFRSRVAHSYTDTVDQAWLITPECRGEHNRITIQWMWNSVFCLEPPGDSPTRKSFYDAVISGCIPVLLSNSRFKVKYPFDDVIDYGKFTVSFPEKAIQSQEIHVVDALKNINQTVISEKQEYMKSILKYLQYSYPLSQDNEDNDAMSLLLRSISSEVRKRKV